MMKPMKGGDDELIRYSFKEMFFYITFFVDLSAYMYQASV